MPHAILLLVITLLLGFNSAQARVVLPMSPMEWGMDRGGADYKVFDLPGDNPSLCLNACARDSRCMAWTYVKPNTIQGPRPRCWLKQAVPPPSRNPACVSGYKLR